MPVNTTTVDRLDLHSRCACIEEVTAMTFSKALCVLIQCCIRVGVVYIAAITGLCALSLIDDLPFDVRELVSPVAIVLSAIVIERGTRSHVAWRYIGSWIVVGVGAYTTIDVILIQRSMIASVPAPAILSGFVFGVAASLDMVRARSRRKGDCQPKSVLCKFEIGVDSTANGGGK